MSIILENFKLMRFYLVKSLARETTFIVSLKLGVRDFSLQTKRKKESKRGKGIKKTLESSLSSTNTHGTAKNESDEKR